jgi:3-keto-5-aminohexanoate cleavage enzyme
MAIPCIITVAITGSAPQKSDNPAVPITINEQIESTHAVFEAGATIAHLHVRKDLMPPTCNSSALHEAVARGDLDGCRQAAPICSEPMVP